MINKTILRQTYAKISGLPDEEVNVAIDSTVHANENTFKDAIKKMATKTDIAEIKAEIRVDIAEIKTELRYMRWFIVIVVSIAVALIKYLP